MMAAPRYSFDEIAVALNVQARELVLRAEDAERVGLQIGLFDHTREHIVAERRLQAALVGEAYRVIRALTAVENTIRAIIDEGAPT